MPAVLNGQAQTLTSVANALYGTAGIASFPNAAVPANNVSLAEVIRSIWAALMGTAVGENGITTWPAAAAPGNAVSLAEGLRYIVESQIGALTNTGAGADTLTGILGDPASVDFATRLGYLQALGGPSYRHGNYLAVTADMSSATWNTIANTHEVFQVEGAVRLRVWIECTSDLTSGGATTIQFGIAGSTAGIIASTGFNDVNAGYWYANTGSVALPTFGNCVMDYVIRNGVDVGYELGTADLTGGTLIFHCVWEPMSSTGSVAAGAGGTL